VGLEWLIGTATGKARESVEVVVVFYGPVIAADINQSMEVISPSQLIQKRRTYCRIGLGQDDHRFNFVKY